jgi:hypothetical protein
MKKAQILFIIIFLNMAFFFMGSVAICQKSDDPAIVEEIENKLNKYKSDYESIETSLTVVSTVDDDLKANIKKTNDKFENYSKVYFSTIENNDNLGSIYDKCVDLQLKIEKKIKDLQEGTAQEEKKSELKNKLNGFFSDYKKMLQQGDLFVKNKNRDSLKVLKEGEHIILLNNKLETLCTENDDLIKKEPELQILRDSINQTKEHINKLYIAPKKDIWGIITKIAILFAMIFFAVMIYNIVKSKQMLKAVKKPNDTPEI